MNESQEGSLREVTEQEYRAHFEEIYRDPETISKLVEEGIGRREEALREFEKEVDSDEGLQRRVFLEPIGVLRERGLLGPFDRVDLQMDHAGALDRLPWPYACFLRCRFVCRVERGWSCVVSHGLRFCYPILIIRCRRECRVICP